MWSGREMQMARTVLMNKKLGRSDATPPPGPHHLLQLLFSGL
jgi:hypothetical protein